MEDNPERPLSAMALDFLGPQPMSAESSQEVNMRGVSVDGGPDSSRGGDATFFQGDN